MLEEELLMLLLWEVAVLVQLVAGGKQENHS